MSRKKTRAPLATATAPIRPETAANAVVAAPTRLDSWLRPTLEPWPSATPDPVSLVLTAVGAALLVVPLVMGISGPPRAPGAGALVAVVCAVAAGVGLLAALLPATRGRDAPALLGLAGAGTLLFALAIMPETFAFPTNGVGDRLFGFPALFGAPLAGAGLLSGRKLGRVVGGAGAALLLIGLLQPFPILDDTRLALVHHLSPWAGAESGYLLGLTAFGALGLASLAAPAGSPLVPIAGTLLAAALPAWELIALIGGATPAAPACLALLVGGTLWLTLGLRSGLGQAPGLVAARLPVLAEAAVVLGALALWVLLKVFSTRWSTTDENIYFYGALLVSKGQLPYRDFFFSHPPMHLIVPGLLFKLFGFSFGLAKSISVVATGVTALLMWALARERLGRLTAFFALVAFLFAHELLQASTNMNGVELTSLWLTAGLYASLRGRPALAGALLGLAVTTGFYAIAGALALLCIGFVRGVRPGLRQLAGFFAVAGGINVLFWAIAGGAYLTGVYGYHVLKQPKPLVVEFLKTLYHHTPLAFGVLLAPVVGAWQRFAGFALPGEPAEPEAPGSFFSPLKLIDEPALGTVKIAFLVCVTLLVELSMFNELYDFYFALAFPTAALCTGYVLAALVGSVVHGAAALVQRRAIAPMLAAGVLVSAYGLWVPTAVEANWSFSNSDRSKGGLPAKGVNPEWLERGERREYPWIEPAALPSIAGPVVRALFWRDHRLKGALVPGYRHYLWQKSLYVDATDTISAYVKQTTAEDETVAGNSLAAPLVALASERRLAGNVVDTNGKVFTTKLSTLKSFFEAICADKIRYLVAAPSGFFSDALFSQLPVVVQQFERVKVFPSPMNKFDKPGVPPFAISLWEVKDKAPTGPRCHWIPGGPPGLE